MRPTQGMNFLASYTLGHAKDHVSGLNIGGERGRCCRSRSATTPRSRRRSTLEKGDALFDVRHRFVFSFSAELPTPENMGTVAASTCSAAGS